MFIYYVLLFFKFYTLTILKARLQEYSKCQIDLCESRQFGWEVKAFLHISITIFDAFLETKIRDSFNLQLSRLSRPVISIVTEFVLNCLFQKELRFAFNNPFLVKIRGGERVMCVKKRIRDYLVSC